MAGAVGTTPSIPTPEELISIVSVNELDETWVNEEIQFLENLAVDRDQKVNKPQLSERLNTIADRATNITNLIRVLYRLTKNSAESSKICDEVVSAISLKFQNTTTDPTRTTYAQALNIPGSKKVPTQPKDPTHPLSNSTPGNKPVSQLSATAPVFTPSPRHEITIVPHNYDSDVKDVRKLLHKSQVTGSRKSRNGNIVLSFPSNESMQSAEQILSKGKLASNEKIKLHMHDKVLPKITIRNVELQDDEIIPSILSKNPKIRFFVDKGYKFDLLFVQKLNLTRHNNGVSRQHEVRNAIIKLDPIIRNCIKENSYKVFVGLQNCTVFDRIHYKTCRNCQKIGIHNTDDCPTKNNPICRFCAQNHESLQCSYKNDPTKHQCSNCLKSANEKFRAESNTHTANSKSCPLVVEISNEIINNTRYEVVEAKND